MKLLLKKILTSLPVVLKRGIVLLHESYYRRVCLKKEKKEYSIKNIHSAQKVQKKRILMYHISGLSFGGTEKTLQNIANNICDDFDVFFLYSNIGITHTRKDYINKKITCIEFKYSSIEQAYPYYIHGMNPHIKNIIEDYSIDLIITTGSGYPYYPINTITTVPIVMINVFGSPSLQENIISNIFVSDTVKKYSEKYTGSSKNNYVLWLPVTEPPVEAKGHATVIRNNFSITEKNFVFGRIGRDDDSIFDPIGIRSFQIIVKKFPNTHYVVMSPPPILRKIVAEEKIPNVHFIQSSANEIDIWGFHYALDCLAHFRKDGETFGLNIAESMYAGNPIISHRSHIWNAHTEYLNSAFSRVAEIDDIAMYTKYMEEFILLKKESPEKWLRMRKSAHDFAKEHFSEKKYKEAIKKIIA